MFLLQELLQWLYSSSLFSVDYQCHPLLVYVCEMSGPPGRPIGRAIWQQEEGPFWAPVERNTVKQSISPRTASRSPALWQPSALILTSRKHFAYSECIFTTEGVGARGSFWQLVGKGGSVKWLPWRIRCLLCRTLFWHSLVRHIQTQITHLDRNGNSLFVQNEFCVGFTKSGFLETTLRTFQNILEICVLLFQPADIGPETTVC